MIIPKLLLLLAPLIVVEAQFFRRYPIRRPIVRPGFRPGPSVSSVTSIPTTTEKLIEVTRDVSFTPKLSAADIEVTSKPPTIEAAPVKSPALTIVYPENYVPSSTISPRPVFSSVQRQPIRRPFWPRPIGRPIFGRPSTFIPSTTVHPATLRPRFPPYITNIPSYTSRRPQLSTESQVPNEIAIETEPPFAAPEYAPTSLPDTGNVVVPNEVSTVQPGTGNVVVPNDVSTVQPDTGDVVVPNEVSTVQPDTGDVVVPNEVSTVQPGTGNVVVPNEVSTVQPDTGDVVVPNEVSTVQPDTGDVVVPNVVSTVQPDTGNVVVPNEVSTVQPDTGDVVVPNEIPTVQPDTGDVVVPNEVSTVQPDIGDVVAPHEIPTVQPDTVDVKPTTQPIQQKPTPSYDVTQLQDYNCRVENGYELVPTQCDAFVECKNNKAHQYTCPDGLHFDPAAVWPAFPCAYPSEVKCESHSVLQPAKPTSDCPRRYGFFPSPTGDCSQYVSCQEGLATIMYCPSGLAFNSVKTSCDWPVNVPGCKPDVFEGFTCPAVPMDIFGKASRHIFKYGYKNSCKKYIACQEGHPRLLSCDTGLSFDGTSKRCVKSELVIDCKN